MWLKLALELHKIYKSIYWCIETDRNNLTFLSVTTILKSNISMCIVNYKYFDFLTSLIFNLIL